MQVGVAYKIGGRRVTSTIPADIASLEAAEVEYETLRRLPKSNTILFTIKGFASPTTDLATVPNAAACLAESLKGMSQAMRTYKGVPDPTQQEEMLAFLAEMSAQADGPAGPSYRMGKSGITAVAR